MAKHVQSIPPRSHHRITTIASAVLLLSVSGCGGDDWQAATYPAQGTISINQAPPAGAVVELRAVGDGPDVRNSRPWAVVADDGTFVLSTYEQGDGAPAGDYKVTVRWPPDVNQPSLADRLAAAYANAERSRWSVTIAAEENQLPPIVITDAKVAGAQTAPTPRKAPPGPGMPK